MGSKGRSLLHIKVQGAAMLINKMHVVLNCVFGFLTVTQASVHYNQLLWTAYGTGYITSNQGLFK